MNSLLSKFSLHALSYNQGEVEKYDDKPLVRQTNTHIFSLLRSTGTKQRFLNSSCFGDHDATVGFADITFLQREISAQKFTEFFFEFVNISSIVFIAFYCKIRLALTYGIHCRSGHILIEEMTTILFTSIESERKKTNVPLGLKKIMKDIQTLNEQANKMVYRFV